LPFSLTTWEAELYTFSAQDIRVAIAIVSVTSSLTGRALKITESNAWVAWQIYGEIIFWMSKPALDKSEINNKCRRLWEALTSELSYEAVDPLMQFQNSDRSVSLKGGLASRMFEEFREPIRKIL
jgi:hypothetical protein